MRASLIRRLTLCRMQMCPFTQGSDETGVWGECVRCGKRSGFIDRATLRAYADREYEAEMRRRATQ